MPLDFVMLLLQSVPPWAIGSLVTVGLFLLGHLGVAVWFASSIKGQVAQLVKSSETMAVELKKLSALDGRIQVIESRMNRAEQDARDALKAAAEMGRHVS